MIVLTYCLASVGEPILGRLSRTLAEWNASFLVGLSLTATLFVPLSWLLQTAALNVTLGILVAAGLVGGLRRVIAFRKGSPRFHIVEGFAAKIFLAILIVVVVQFAAENYRLTYLWDGYQIWATKALVIFDRGELTQALLTPHDPDLVSFPNCCDGAERVAAYPPAIPLFEALVAKSEGAFVWEAVKAIFPVFFISLLISTFQAARAFVPTAVALAACVLLALVPAVALDQNVGGYADMPQAALLAGFLAAVLAKDGSRLPSYRQAAPWLLGGVLLVKSEGAILFAILCAAIAVLWASEGIGKFVTALRRNAGAIVVALTCAGLRGIYLLWIDTKDLTYGPLDKPHFVQAYARLWTVPVACAHFMLNRADWGVFWPVFFVSAGIVIWKGDRRARLLCAGTLAALAAYTSIFYFTNWEVHLHIEQAYTRLLAQLSPAAAVLTVVAYQCLAGRRQPEGRAT